MGKVRIVEKRQSVRAAVFLSSKGRVAEAAAFYGLIAAG
jgi:hypothetical protein